MDEYSGNSFGTDPFTRFWSEWMSKMTGAGVSTGSIPDDTLKIMRRAFFDAWAHHCDEFMRSPAFLDGMKKAMDGALAFREQLNEYMTRALHEAQAPARSDTDSIMLVLRSLEERVLDRLDRLEDRISSLEDSGGSAEPAREHATHSQKKPQTTGHKRKGASR